MNNPLGLRILTTTIAGVMTISMVACNKLDDSTGAPAPSITVGTEIDDGMVTTRVKSALLADADIKGLDIKVETRKGEVMLSGFVNNQGQIERAVEVARGVAGVTKVGNDMSLKK
ncbi:MAG: BON domain-containing protein [Rhodoferax sp.]|jgi:hyperosmotically inducible protein|nr:BON domain-containing protein [Rhodoferax sp.]